MTMPESPEERMQLAEHYAELARSCPEAQGRLISATSFEAVYPYELKVGGADGVQIGFLHLKPERIIGASDEEIRRELCELLRTLLVKKDRSRQMP